jgi:hypothetical protein
MNEEIDFIEQILKDAEAAEDNQRKLYYDLLLVEISKLQKDIEINFNNATLECQIINNWAIQINSKIQSKLDFLEMKIESYLKETGLKTMDLAHGILKLYKKPDRVEVNDLEAFLSSATSELLNIIPEQVKPDLNKIKAFIKSKGRVPSGVQVIPGTESFSYKLKTKESER